MKFLFLSSLSALVFSSVLGSASAFASNPIQELCAEDYGSPKVTPKADGTFLVCDIVPAVYVTREQAEATALEDIAKEADRVCKSGARPVDQPKVIARKFAVTVISRFACD